jgi:hypothetical protein
VAALHKFTSKAMIFSLPSPAKIHAANLKIELVSNLKLLA